MVFYINFLPDALFNKSFRAGVGMKPAIKFGAFTGAGPMRLMGHEAAGSWEKCTLFLKLDIGGSSHKANLFHLGKGIEEILESARNGYILVLPFI